VQRRQFHEWEEVCHESKEIKDTTNDAFVPTNQDCQIFLGAMYQSGEKTYQITSRLPNGRKMIKIVIIFSNIFHSKVLHSIPKAGLLV
jgi:hypothetical protein